MSNRKITIKKAVTLLKRNRKISISAIIVVAIIGVILLSLPRNYALAINGEVIGVAKDIDEVNRAIENVEAKVSRVLGREYSLSDAVQVSESNNAIDENANLESLILDNISEVKYLYTLQIDGQDVAACETEEELRTALDNVLKKYSNIIDGKANFDCTVSIKNSLAPVSTKATIQEIEDLIDPITGKYPASVRTVAYEVSERTIPYGSEYVCDESKYIGDSKILQPGTFGTAEVTNRVVYINGKETERSEISVKEIVSPQSEIIAVGTCEYPYYTSKGYYIWPARGMITSEFGYRENSIGSANHQGVDIAAYTGYPIIAADGGEVIFSGWIDSYGNIVKIRHDNGDVTWYAHCSSLVVSYGDKVGQGQLIAYMGETGVASGPHLHFELRLGGTTPVNGLEYLVD